MVVCVYAVILESKCFGRDNCGTHGFNAEYRFRKTHRFLERHVSILLFCPICSGYLRKKRKVIISDINEFGSVVNPSRLMHLTCNRRWKSRYSFTASCLNRVGSIVMSLSQQQQQKVDSTCRALHP